MFSPLGQAVVTTKELYSGTPAIFIQTPLVQLLLVVCLPRT